MPYEWGKITDRKGDRFAISQQALQARYNGKVENVKARKKASQPKVYHMPAAHPKARRQALIDGSRQ